MTVTKKFKDLVVKRNLLLRNKHVAILVKHKIDDISEFVRQKIEELETPEEPDKLNKEVEKELKEVDTEVQSGAELKEVSEKELPNIFGQNDTH